MVVDKRDWNHLVISIVALAMMLAACILCAGLLISDLRKELYKARAETTELKATLEEQGIDVNTLRLEAIKTTMRESQIRSLAMEVNPSLTWTQANTIAKSEVKWSKRYSVPLYIGLAKTWQESHFKPMATSPTGPKGIKQIALKWNGEFCGLNSSNVYDIDKNIECGYKVVAQHYKSTHSWKKSLEMYYGGTAKENEEYMLTVMGRVAKIQTMITT